MVQLQDFGTKIAAVIITVAVMSNAEHRPIMTPRSLLCIMSQRFSFLLKLSLTFKKTGTGLLVRLDEFDVIK